MLSYFRKPFVLKMLRYLISGGIAAAVDLVSLYVLTDLLWVWYLVSATIAFVLTLVTSFVLQKFWTFKNTGQGGAHRQFAGYLSLSIANLFVNAGLMYLFVTVLGIQYLAAQVAAIAIIAGYGFFLYQHWIFREKKPVAPLEHSSYTEAQ